MLLLVEDNPDDIALARRAMSRSDVKAVLEVARSGPEALEMLTSTLDRLPRAVFLDLNMPEWNGFDVLRRVRANSKIRTVPIIVLTTSKEPDDITRSYLLGANSFVTKPVDFGEFTELFAKMIQYWVGVNQQPVL